MVSQAGNPFESFAIWTAHTNIPQASQRQARRLILNDLLVSLAKFLLID